jgi:hypothetical protein
MAEFSTVPSNSRGSESLQSKLEVILDALDSSQDGIAIWKVIRGINQTVRDFELVLINAAGAAKAGQPQLDLIGKTLTAVVGIDTAINLRTLFSRALKEGRGLKEIVPGIDANGVHGSYENSVVPFGNDLVFATYRDVSESVEER